MKRVLFPHEIFSNYPRDTLYKNIKVKSYNLRRPISILKFLIRLNYKKYVIHFYNNIWSQKFNVDSDKIKVIQNGFSGNHILIQKEKKKKKILL